MSPENNPHRRADDTKWYVRFGRTTRTVLPPCLAIFFAVLCVHVAEVAHTINTPMAMVIGGCLATSFGPMMFERWITHRESMQGATSDVTASTS